MNETKRADNVDSNSIKHEPKAKIALRPYFAETDKKYVHYLFYSTYFNLVPKAVLIRLRSPYIIASWVAIYTLIVTFVWNFFERLGWERKVQIALVLFTTVIVIGFGFISLLWYTDKFDITPRVVQGIENDLKEPCVYYRGTPEEPRKGNFWVLTLNDEIIGCVGIDHTPVSVVDKSADKPYVRASERPRAVDSPEIHQAEWKRTAMMLARLDDLVRLTLVGALDKVRDFYFKIKGVEYQQQQEPILFEAHKSNEASVRRLAIKLECQNHGLSTILLKRVAFWAHAHQLEYLYAETDELQTKLAEILVKRHGYTFVSKKKLGYFKTKSIFRLDVKLWMSKELERRAQEKAEKEQLKEEAELKEYE
ncbi:uncharacterized protein BX663DRAFT_550767 [Cokeromyces recurvatus]|uniref:uncharacterized protein n=1 Tax=Cokeromyces recurvatus TaxID=90255 RepID=UPI002220AA1B|nr:uncharacterized protein BX663DRAFT_550767 [Cokeromyces recurvatus]KAI7904386.1 hypothetical protein BX663DRAFT_550767 [Cokeromyces recurvatus]